MSPPTIRKKLLISICALMIITIGISSTSLYFKIRQSYYQTIDSNLEKIATLLALKIKVIDTQDTNDQLAALNHETKNLNKIYLQIWKTDKTVSAPSPNLKTTQLPFFHGKLHEHVFRDVTLPDQKRGRAIGTLTFPNNKDTPDSKEKKNEVTKHPAYVFVVATEVEQSLESLTELRLVFILTAITLLVTISLIITLIIRSSLHPIKDLSNQIKQARHFSANAAHELKTPLTGISTTLELTLTQPRDSSYYRKSIIESLRISDSMQKLLERLMSLSKLQSDSYPLRTEHISAHELISTIWDESTQKAEQRNISVHWKLCHTVNKINTDKLLFTTLLRNLLDNAISYAPESSEISIETRYTKGKIHLLVSNKTHALQEKDVQLFFQPFYRQAPTDTKMENHHGIGLCLCWEIARALNGTISANLAKDNRLTIEFISHIS